MELFAFIMLLALLFIVTNLYNWTLRLLVKDGGGSGFFLCIVVSVVYFGIGCSLIKYIIKWGYPLLF